MSTAKPSPRAGAKRQPEESPALGGVVDELHELQTELEVMAFLMRYVLDARRVFDVLRDATKRDSALAAALASACADWQNPDAIAGITRSSAWLADEMHTRACMFENILGDLPARGAA